MCYNEESKFLPSSPCNGLGVVGRMLGPLQKLLGPAKVQLQHYIKEVEQLISKPIEGGMMTEEELTLEDLIECMNNVSVIEQCNANWTSLLQDLKGKMKGMLRCY